MVICGFNINTEQNNVVDFPQLSWIYSGQILESILDEMKFTPKSQSHDNIVPTMWPVFLQLNKNGILYQKTIFRKRKIQLLLNLNLTIINPKPLQNHH